MIGKSPGELIRQVLDPLADARGFEYSLEALDPTAGRTAAGAFHFVMCGARILLGLTYADEVPATDRRTGRRVAKAVRGSLRYPEAGLASVFLTQGLAALLEQTMRRHGDDAAAAVHREAADLVQAVYPLEPYLLDRLDACLAEFRVLETHEVREEIRHGTEIGTKYHMALMDPEGPWGSEPDEDPEAIEVQERFAAAYLRSSANLSAIEIVLGVEKYRAVAPQLLRAGSSNPDVLLQRVSDQLLWNHAADDWHEYAALAFA